MKRAIYVNVFFSRAEDPDGGEGGCCNKEGGGGGGEKVLKLELAVV